MDIMLVEDDEAIRECLREALEDAGLKTSGHATAETAVEAFDESGAPAVLVTDINLGDGLDGIALADIARRRAGRLKVLYISGRYSGVPGLSPPDAFMRKPFRLAAFVDAVASMCSRAGPG